MSDVFCPTESRFNLVVQPNKSVDAYAHIFTYNDQSATAPMCHQVIPVPHDTTPNLVHATIPLPGTNSNIMYAPLTWIHLSLSPTLEPKWVEGPNNIITVVWWSNGVPTETSCGPNAYGGIQAVYPGNDFKAQLRLTGPGNASNYQAEGLFIFDWEKVKPACPTIAKDGTIPCQSTADCKFAIPCFAKGCLTEATYCETWKENPVCHMADPVACKSKPTALDAVPPHMFVVNHNPERPF